MHTLKRTQTDMLKHTSTCPNSSALLVLVRYRFEFQGCHYGVIHGVCRGGKFRTWECLDNHTINTKVSVPSKSKCMHRNIYPDSVHIHKQTLRVCTWLRAREKYTCMLIHTPICRSRLWKNYPSNNTTYQWVYAGYSSGCPCAVVSPIPSCLRLGCTIVRRARA